MIENTVQVAHTAYAVTAVVFLLACTRFLLRRLKNERIFPDDWLMIVALFMLGGFTSTFPVLLDTGTGPYGQSDDETPLEKQFDSKYIMFGRISYLTYIWLLKACILIYYYRLTARQPEQRYVIFTCWGIGLTWITTMLLWMTACRPFNLNWKVTNPPQECARWQVGMLFMSISIIVTNFILVTIPLPMIWRTQMAIGTKFKVSAVFLVGIFLIVISIIRTILQESGIQKTDDRYFWGEMECLLMAFFASAPVLNSLYRRVRAGAGSNHLPSTSQIGSGRNTDGIELCTANDFSREIDFMEVLRGGPVPDGDCMKETGCSSLSPALPTAVKIAPPPSHLTKRKVVPNTNMLLSVSRSRGTNRDSLHCVQTVEIVQTSEPADPNDPMMTNPLGGIGKVETKISHHDASPLPSNANVYNELYSSAHRSTTLEDMLGEPPGPIRRHNSLNHRV